MNKVTREVAEAEIEKWLDAKKVRSKEREDKKESIEQLIECLIEGDLIVSEKGEFVHKLLFPVTSDKGEILFSELHYKLRINDKMQAPNLKGVGNGDADGRFNALIATLTDKSRSIIAGLDTADKKIAMAIGIFFL